jgi:hypothetical protein
MAERWRAVPGYEKCYEVSDQGRVRSLTRRVDNGTPSGMTLKGRNLQQYMKGRRRQYPTVELSRDGRQRGYQVHTLVLEAFVGPRPPGMFGLHRDDDKSNTWLDNLYWGTRADNTEDRKRNGGYSTPAYLARKGRPRGIR